MKRGDEQTSSECSGCSAKHCWLLHHVRHMGNHHLYCTSCVLKFHPGSFCFNCFDFFEGPPPSDSIKCSKCPSLSHSSCLGSDPLPSRFLCSTCSNPSFSFFNPLPHPPAPSSRPIIDLTAAKVLVAAAMIAAQSMRKVAATARFEADRKVREANFARKRARKALEKTAGVLLPPAKDKQSSKVVLSSGTAGVEQRRNAVANAPVVTPAAAAQKRLQNSTRPGNMISVACGEKKSALASGNVQIQRLPPKNIEVKGSNGPASEPMEMIKEERKESLIQAAKSPS